jgi:dTMP kinase
MQRQTLQNKGLFITFEGGEGVSKSTQSVLLQEYLRNAGRQVILTREPGGTKFGEQLRSIVLNIEIESLSELLCMMSARNQHICNIIKPALSDGSIVICDRFVDSTACYQTLDNIISVEEVYSLHERFFGNFLPDVTILLDLAPEIGLERIRMRKSKANDKNDLKDLNYHQQIYQRYHLLANMFPDRIKIIDASGGSEQIHKNIVELLAKCKIVL